MRKLVVFGAGGFGQEAIWVAESMNTSLSNDERWEILGYIDNDADKIGMSYYDYPVIEAPRDADVWFHCALGDNHTRQAQAERMEALGWHGATLIHPSVIRARHVAVGEGTYIGAGTVLSPNATIGRHVLINQRVSIGHDVVLADFSQASPGAQINGRCRVGRAAYVGSNASVHQGKTIGDDAVVGANAQVVTDVKKATTVAGVPARRLSSRG